MDEWRQASSGAVRSVCFRQLPKDPAVAILESLLRYYVQRTQRIGVDHCLGHGWSTGGDGPHSGPTATALLVGSVVRTVSRWSQP